MLRLQSRLSKKKIVPACVPADAQIEGGKEYKIALGVSDFGSIFLITFNLTLPVRPVREGAQDSPEVIVRVVNSYDRKKGR